MPRGRFRRIFFRTAIAIVVVLVALMALGAWLVRSDPSWYRALKLSAAEQAAAERRLMDRLALLRNDVGRVEAVSRQTTAPIEWPTFEFTLTEDEVNGPLTRWTQGGPVAQWLASNPDTVAALREIQEPHVRFLPDRIELAGRSLRLNTLVSIELSVEQPSTPDGFPTVTLGRPWAGRMPLSRSILEEPAIAGLEALRADRRSSVPPAVIDSAEGLIRGEPVTAVIPLDSSTDGAGLLAARVERLVLTEGKLEATLRPLPRVEQKLP